MTQETELHYQLLLSFIAFTLSVLNQSNPDLKRFGHASFFANHPTD